jgi:hypothetical protein
MSEKIEFDLSVKNNQLSKSLDEASKKSEFLEKSLTTTAGVIAGNLLTGAFTKLTGSIVSFGKESIKAFSQQEDALNQLGQALKASGDFSQSAVADFSAFASELQSVSKFGDEVVISQIAVAKSLGATNEQSKQLVKAAADLSATFGGSLEENVRKLGRTLNGDIGRLGQLIPQLRSLTEEQLRSGEALAVVNQRFGGAAASELNTYSGSVVAASNAFSDLQEAVGGFLVESLNLKGVNNALKGLYEELTRAVSDYVIEQQRANGTLQETSSTVDQAQRSVDKLKTQISDYQAVIDRNKDAGLLDSLFTFDNVPRAKEEILRLTEELKKAESSLQSARGSLETNPPPATQNKAAKERTLQAINQEKELQSQILSIRQQFANEETAFNENLFVQELENQGIQNGARIAAIAEQKLRENEVILQAELDKAKLIQDPANEAAAVELANQKKRLNDQKVFNQKSLAESKFKADQERQIEASRIAALQGFLGAGIALAKQGSIEQKALQIASATTATYTAANLAYQSPPGPPYTIPLVAATIAQGLANVAKIRSQKFADGGVVGGSITGASNGPDNMTAQVRQGEMVLNANQQEKLFRMIDSGSMGGDIVIQINSREIARAVRDEIKSGFRIGA